MSFMSKSYKLSGTGNYIDASGVIYNKKELPNYFIEIKDKNGELIQKIDCDKIFKLSNISELRCTLDETYVNGEKVDYLIGVKF